jgi:RNA polymerase sigma factor (TIGR02999 family)
VDCLNSFNQSFLFGNRLSRVVAYPRRVSDLTRILDAIQRGDSKPADELLPLVYDELRKLAAHKMAHQPPGQTLQATALVHEAYLRLLGKEQVQWNSRGHFFSAAAEAMRRILIERARKKSARKHGGMLKRVDFDSIDIALDTDDDLLLLLDEALEEFKRKDPTAAELIKLRFFVGLSNDQAAQMLGVSERTAKRSWAYARAWLYVRMQKDSFGE